jgi:predicted aldo/keto reductase-like oxidoreductase
MTEPDTRKEEMMAALEGSLQRLQTDYVDVFLNHAVNDVRRLQSPEWGEFTEIAKQQGKIRFRGMSGHGGRLQDCLHYALDHDLADVILCAHNFGSDPAFYERFTEAFDLIANQKGITEVFKKAKQQDVGVVVMKTLMGAKLNDLRRYELPGSTFSGAAFRWVLSNPDVDALVVSMKSTALVDEYVSASGTAEMGFLDRRMLRNYVRDQGTRTCRQACERCNGSCPAGVPIADVLRARMYAVGYEDLDKARQSWAALDTNASACVSCTSQACLGACPFGLDIPSLTRDAAERLDLA